MAKSKSALLWQFEDESRVALVKLAYAKVTGDLISALLLTQIVYWFTPSADGSSKLHVFRNGRFWLAKARGDWEAEIGLTRRRFDRACDLLESMGIITRAVFKWKGAPTIHLGLNIEVLAGFVHNCKINISEPRKSKDITKTYKSYTETTESTSSTSKGGAKKMKASEVKKKFDAKHNPTAGHPVNLPMKNAAELAKWWMRLVPYYCDVGYMKDLTRKDIGQLGKLLKHVGKQEAYGVMHWAIRNWDRFALDVSKAKGQATAQLPHVGALLQHHDIAVRGFKNKDEQLTATTGSYLLSDEEVQQLIDGGKGGGGS